MRVTGPSPRSRCDAPDTTQPCWDSRVPGLSPQSRCDARGWHARLIAAEHIAEGGEITVGGAPHVSGGDRDALGYEVAFDGALRTIRGIRVAGAGAVLRGPIGSSGRELLTKTVVALPGV